MDKRIGGLSFLSAAAAALGINGSILEPLRTSSGGIKKASGYKKGKKRRKIKRKIQKQSRKINRGK